MALHPLDLMEPEETVGKLWHNMAEGIGAAVHFPDAAVALTDVRTSVNVLFRGLGGASGVEVSDAPAQLVQHRRRLRRRLQQKQEREDDERREARPRQRRGHRRAAPKRVMSRSGCEQERRAADDDDCVHERGASVVADGI